MHLQQIGCAAPPTLIVMVVPGGIDARGGIGRQARYVVRAWRDEPADCDLHVLDSYGDAARQMPLRFIGCCAAVVSRSLRGRIALLHLHMAADGSTARKLILLFLAKALAVKVIVHVHGSRMADFYAGMPRPLRALVRALLARADAVIAIGSFWRDFLCRTMALPEQRVHVIHNAVPAAVAPRQVAGECRILFLGRLGERKGVPDLLAALAALGDTHPGWRAVLAGDGDLDRWRHAVQARGLADRVTLPGWTEDTAALLADADLLVLPSRNEGLPMCILEAMAYGLPVIATPVGAVADAVAHECTGLLVPVGDAPALADALRRLVEHPEEREAMGAAGFRAWQAQYSIDAHWRKLRTLYGDVLGAAPPVGALERA